MWDMSVYRQYDLEGELPLTFDSGGWIALWQAIRPEEDLCSQVSPFSNSGIYRSVGAGRGLRIEGR